jgi:predicted RNA-binding Zn ribbon-like protein
VASTRIGELAVVGGHRAIDLVNTVAPRLPVADRYDYLTAPGDLVTWSRRTGLIDAEEAADVVTAWDASPAAARRALAAVKETREALYEVLAAYLADNRGSPGLDDDLGHLSLAWASAVSRSRLAPATDGNALAHWAVGSSPALMVPDRLAQDAVDLLCATDVTQLGCCPVEAGGCGWLFLDHTRNHSRRWCAMEDCGSGAKAKRLTERRRQSRAGATR